MGSVHRRGARWRVRLTRPRRPPRPPANPRVARTASGSTSRRGVARGRESPHPRDHAGGQASPGWPVQPFATVSVSTSRRGTGALDLPHNPPRPRARRLSEAPRVVGWAPASGRVCSGVARPETRSGRDRGGGSAPGRTAGNSGARVEDARPGSRNRSGRMEQAPERQPRSGRFGSVGESDRGRIRGRG